MLVSTMDLSHLSYLVLIILNTNPFFYLLLLPTHLNIILINSLTTTIDPSTTTIDPSTTMIDSFVIMTYLCSTMSCLFIIMTN